MDMLKLREKMGEEEFDAGRGLYRRGAVREITRSADALTYSVAASHSTVRLFADGRAECVCDRSPLCRHTVAALMEAASSGAMRALKEMRARRRSGSLLDAMEGALPESTVIKLEPEIRMNGTHMRIGLRIGQDRLYVIRSIPEFIDCIDRAAPLFFGKGFTFFPAWMLFPQPARDLIDILRVHCATLTAAKVSIGVQDARLMPLPGPTALRVWDVLRQMKYRLQTDDMTESILQEGMLSEPLPLIFTLSDRARPQSGQHRLCITASFEGKIKPLTNDCSYALVDQNVCSVSRTQRSVARICAAEATDGNAAFIFEPEQTQKVMSEMTLWLSRVGEMRYSPELESQLVRYPFRAKVYLDRAGRDVVARTEFIYGEHVIDPFAPPDEKISPLLLRDAQREQEITELLAGSGFRVSSGRVYLTGSDDVYRFVTEGASKLLEYAEVFFSNDFRKLTPRKALLTGTLRGAGAKLQLDLEDNGMPVEELLPLMRALRDRASYFRFKNGSFITLDNTQDWQPLAEAVCEATELTDNRDLGMYRAAYMDALIRNKNLPVELDEEAARAANLDMPEVKSPITCLRPYQERGFQWLCALHSLHMGGILADDMGLGKTIQTIAAVLYYVQTEKEKKTSVIVAPTSLTYNWLSELKRFAPDLDVMLLSGSQASRAEQIKLLSGPEAPDVLVTSYPLIRRDANLLSDIPFRFAILDEAQHIKNASSVGAHAVKLLKADTRIALTGTPMENHAGELWSIFDFILPGYLPRAGAFMRRYGEGENSEELLRRIRPFLMRRLKKDVLTELPDKLEVTMMAEMSPEQRKVYQAGLARRREYVKQILSTRGMAKGRADVLSAITELRQICCHPALCLPDYAGASGKLEMLADVLLPAIQSGRRALVFSQFTRMLKLIESRLTQDGIKCLYLDGDTPADERVKMCADFNAGKGHVFLLSLKAGGTGLNLTGADMVIHYDPWWNPAAEEQAVDRAHRIGQTKEVEVIRLLMHDSIEEQVVNMSKSKRKLFDLLITPGESMPTKLTDKDLLSLFEGA
ncbi:MAG: SNF2 helicase associated domain-containing protein [Clostridia bacterium]|nr:SNF2 helicase associated domain-containing protein [Clostridia bacterium]